MILIYLLENFKRRVFVRSLNDSYIIYKKSAVTFISSTLQSLTNVSHRFLFFLNKTNLNMLYNIYSCFVLLTEISLIVFIEFVAIRINSIFLSFF